MELKTDKQLTTILEHAVTAYQMKNFDNFNQLLEQGMNRISKLMDLSKNTIKTAITVEYSCLLFDKDISAPNAHDKINSRLNGCINALKDLDALQNKPDEYVKDFLLSKTDTESATVFTKEIKTNHIYLSNSINAPLISNTFPRQLYDKRRDCLTIARNKYIDEKRILLANHGQDRTSQKNDKSRERQFTQILSDKI